MSGGWIVRGALATLAVSLAAFFSPASGSPDSLGTTHTWTFVSIPDFLNVDTVYPQPGWEKTLGYVLEAIKAEEPDFVLIPGDLVMGRWWSEEKIAKYAAIYYPAWIRRMEAHGLKFYAAVGDHEIGDNPWPPERAALVPAFREAFREYLKMPANGPEGLEGCAYYFLHRNTLFICVDVFEPGEGEEGEIAMRVTGPQLDWIRKTVASHPGVDHIIVAGHTPILGPVRKETTSGLMLEGGRGSPLWRTMVLEGVDLYLCGEVHAVTCIERDRIQQVVHGGLFGFNPRVNYLVARVSPQTIDLEIKEIEIVCEGNQLWQEGRSRPSERISIPQDIAERGFVTIGTMVIDKTGDRKIFKDKTGCFVEADNPRD